MSKYYNKKRIITILLLLIFFSGIIFLPVINKVSDHLSKTSRVDANILLVEGWLTSYEIEMAYKEFNKNGYTYIITSGLKLPEDTTRNTYIRDKIINNYNSEAESARKRFLAMGIDSSKIVAIPAHRVKINKTLTSALAVREWLKTTKVDVKGINIVSSGTHASRTWMIYHKVLDKKYNLGIISLPDYRANHSRKNRVLKTLRESFKIVYYWFILLPY